MHVEYKSKEVMNIKPVARLPEDDLKVCEKKRNSLLTLLFTRTALCILQESLIKISSLILVPVSNNTYWINVWL